MGPRYSSRVRLTVSVISATLWLLVAISSAAGHSTAHEPRPPWQIFDLVPGEPPADTPPPSPKTPQVETVRKLPEPKQGPQGDIVPPRVLPYAETWYDGVETTISWDPPPDASQVRFYFYGEKARLGGRSRGKFDGVINGGMIPNTGSVTWTPPWLDGPAATLRMAAYDDEENRIAVEERTIRLLPREFAKTEFPRVAIAISKRRQRLYFLVDGEIRRMHMISTAARGYTTPVMKPGSKGRRGAMGKVFSKSPNPFSSLYRVHMPYWLGITSSGSHGIHATSPGYYRRLGSPASHGCVRQHRSDARKLYSQVNVGTPVYIL